MKMLLKETCQIIGLVLCSLVSVAKSDVLKLEQQYFELPTFGSEENCNKVRLKEKSGVIRSPGYPITYRNHTSCTWYISAEPHETVTLTFIDINIEEDAIPCLKHPCCTSNWLKIIPGPDENRFCGQNGFLPLPMKVTGEVAIKFHTSVQTKGGRGFTLNYVVGGCLEGQLHCYSGVGCYNTYDRCDGRVNCADFSDEMDCGRCSFNHTSCSLTSQHCYNPFSQRCNRVLDCPNGEDEQSCEPGCENRILCSSGVGCYSLEERCNGVAQCSDASDEKFCSADLCRSERGGFLCGNKHCIRETWCCDRTNDCGDTSDEMNCLRNSVIAAAIIGSLICGLLLVVAISCSCRLYALRAMGSQTLRRETPLSQLEVEFLYREPPPSYAVAVGDSPLCYPNMAPSRSSSRVRPSRSQSRRNRSHRTRGQAPIQHITREQTLLRRPCDLTALHGVHVSPTNRETLEFGHRTISNQSDNSDQVAISVINNLQVTVQPSRLDKIGSEEPLEHLTSDESSAERPVWKDEPYLATLDSINASTSATSDSLQLLSS